MNKDMLSAIGLAMLMAVGSASTMASSDEVSAQGPLPFERYDTDGDGTITEQEYQRVHSERMQQRQDEGRGMRYSDDTPRFGNIDSDGDGRISRQELQHHHEQRLEMREERRMERQESGGMGYGKGRY